MFLSLDEFVRNPLGLALRVQISDIQMIGT
jgi:hypothetical protein